jgi:drug/metabolite transporter (DMT)-like permease
MIAATLMWSVAGVVTRHLDAARSFEVTFWRALFCALALAVLLGRMRGPGKLVRALRDGDTKLWLSGVCWMVMFTAYMLALTLTTVANVLVTMALGPLLTALIARLVLGHRLATRTWVAIGVAGAGIAWMYAAELGGGQARHLLGTAVALCVPVAAAVNWSVLQHNRGAGSTDMLPAVLIGAVLASLVTFALAQPLAASAHDIGLLAMLGVFQLAVPCLMAVAAARVLSAPEASLLSLLEVIFGVAWAWLGAGESPTVAVLGGGLLVLLALAGNETLALRQRR